MSLDQATAGELKAALAAIPVTPLGPTGQPGWDARTRIIGRMLDAGLTLITPNGSTGEFSAPSPPEARQATESAARVCAGRAEVLAGAGPDVASAVAAGEHTAAAGARMVMVHQPASPYRGQP